MPGCATDWGPCPLAASRVVDDVASRLNVTLGLTFSSDGASGAPEMVLGTTSAPGSWAPYCAAVSLLAAPVSAGASSVGVASTDTFASPVGVAGRAGVAGFAGATDVAMVAGAIVADGFVGADNADTFGSAIVGSVGVVVASLGQLQNTVRNMTDKSTPRKGAHTGRKTTRISILTSEPEHDRTKLCSTGGWWWCFSFPLTSDHRLGRVRVLFLLLRAVLWTGRPQGRTRHPFR